MTSPAATPTTPSPAFWCNSLLFEYLPNAGLTPTERDVLDILLSRQEAGGVVFITQPILSARLKVAQPNISKALARLSELGIIEPAKMRRRGRVRIHKLLAAYEGPRQAISAMHDPNVPDWPLNISTSSERPARTSSPTPAGAAPQEQVDAKARKPKLRLV
ncbi:hypothetical protein ACFQ0M_48010 [Kitasatospora aburaviensis]|uniref:MarR family transcriptional regulator n=1 Tax=Kitasatospora aburaviensis TaxID=67265 RepID=A0ABW1EYU0_9ACTN